MKTAFLVTKYELFGSILELGETIAELKKNGYERCVIVDSSLSSFVKWHTALSRAGIVTVPGLHKGNDYWIARSETGFRELMKARLSNPMTWCMFWKTSQSGSLVKEPNLGVPLS
jgi:DNA polymerase-3 subunit alpha